jgi:hypothetical protein
MLPAARRQAALPLPAIFYQLSLDMFTIVEHWDPSGRCASERGRVFEQILYRYCDYRRWTLSERAGSRTVRGKYAASGFMHESDGVIVTPELTLMLELKYLGGELGKNELLVFNQKGLDVLAADGRDLRAKPFYRAIVSGSILTPAARRFAAQWGILVIEPERLPLPLLHRFAAEKDGYGGRPAAQVREAVLREVPQLIVPLQARLRRLVRLLDEDGELMGTHRLDRILGDYQRVAGDEYWSAMDERVPGWLEDRFDELNWELDLDDTH